MRSMQCNVDLGDQPLPIPDHNETRTWNAYALNVEKARSPKTPENIHQLT